MPLYVTSAGCYYVSKSVEIIRNYIIQILLYKYITTDTFKVLSTALEEGTAQHNMHYQGNPVMHVL